MNMNSSRQELVNKNREIYTKYRKGDSLKDADTASKLCGLITIVFKSDENKKYYDYLLKTKDIWEEFFKSYKSVKTLSYENYLIVVKRIKDILNISNEDAKNFVNTVVNYCNLIVVDSSNNIH